jgi:hypothetical protein
MRVVEGTHVVALGRARHAGDSWLHGKVGLAQATAVDEDVLCAMRSALQNAICDARRHLLAVVSMGSSSGFFRSGNARRETMVAFGYRWDGKKTSIRWSAQRGGGERRRVAWTWFARDSSAERGPEGEDCRNTLKC